MNTPRRTEVVKRFLSGESPAEISESLGIAYNTVNVHLYQARQLNEIDKGTKYQGLWISLPRKTVVRLEREARSRKILTHKMIRDLLTNAVEADLFKALLDD